MGYVTLDKSLKLAELCFLICQSYSTELSPVLKQFMWGDSTNVILLHIQTLLSYILRYSQLALWVWTRREREDDLQILLGSPKEVTKIDYCV